MPFDLLPGRLRLNNQVMVASGTFGYGDEFAERNDLGGIGAVICKGITRRPRAGHSTPRIVETSGGILNAIGLANIGVDAVIRHKATVWTKLPTPVIVNINGETEDEYVEVAGLLSDATGVAGLELNIACPNLDSGGMVFGCDPKLAGSLTRRVRETTDLPLLVKLTPNTDRIIEVAEAVVDAGAEALTVANTYLGLAFDVQLGRPSLDHLTGGLSGPAIKPLTLRLVHELSRRVSIPIVGCGGIMSGKDAAEYLLAGARAVQVGTANLVDPFAAPRIAMELSRWL